MRKKQRKNGSGDFCSCTMATLRGLANNRASEAADDPAYGHVATRTDSHEAPKRHNSEERVTKKRTVWAYPRPGARAPRGSAAFGE